MVGVYWVTDVRNYPKRHYVPIDQTPVRHLTKLSLRLLSRASFLIGGSEKLPHSFAQARNLRIPHCSFWYPVNEFGSAFLRARLAGFWRSTIVSHTRNMRAVKRSTYWSLTLFCDFLTRSSVNCSLGHPPRNGLWSVGSGIRFAEARGLLAPDSGVSRHERGVARMAETASSASPSFPS